MLDSSNLQMPKRKGFSPPNVAFASRLNAASEDACGTLVLRNGIRYAGVYDGHRGRLASNICNERIPELLECAYASGATTICALRSAFLGAHNEVTDESGSTASVVLIRGAYIAIGYVGDSRVILCRGGVCVNLTTDHRVGNESERCRIKQAHLADSQCPTFTGATLDRLMITRSIGDHSLSKCISPLPVVVELLRGHETEFIVLATDGLWDVCDGDKVAELVKTRRLETAAEIAECLAHYASVQYRDRGAQADDITCGVIFLNASTEDPRQSKSFWSFEAQMEADMAIL